MSCVFAEISSQSYDQGHLQFTECPFPLGVLLLTTGKVCDCLLATA